MSEQPTPATPAIDPARVIAVRHLDADVLGVYVDGTKQYEAGARDDWGAHECMVALGVAFRELEVCYDGPMPDSLEKLMEHDARVRRQVWDQDRGAFRDPADGSLWTEDGWQIEED